MLYAVRITKDYRKILSIFIIHNSQVLTLYCFSLNHIANIDLNSLPTIKFSFSRNKAACYSIRGAHVHSQFMIKVKASNRQREFELEVTSLKLINQLPFAHLRRSLILHADQSLSD